MAILSVVASLTVDWWVRHELASITPAWSLPAGMVPCTISGIGFHTNEDAEPEAVITGMRFRRSGYEDVFIEVTSFTVVNDTTITASIPPALTAPLGYYDLLADVNDPGFPDPNPIILYSAFQYTDTPPHQWCFNPTSQHYVYAIDCPGPPFISGVEPPTITISGFTPRST